MYVVFFIHKMQAKVLHSFSMQYLKKGLKVTKRVSMFYSKAN